MEQLSNRALHVPPIVSAFFFSPFRSISSCGSTLQRDQSPIAKSSFPHSFLHLFVFNVSCKVCTRHERSPKSVPSPTGRRNRPTRCHCLSAKWLFDCVDHKMTRNACLPNEISSANASYHLPAARVAGAPISISSCAAKINSYFDVVAVTARCIACIE